jgi:hypothetical protein
MKKRIPKYITPKRVIAVYATDWAYRSTETRPDDNSIGPMRAWVTGFLWKETDDFISIASHIFDDNDGRHILSIPKVNIIKRVNLS